MTILNPLHLATSALLFILAIPLTLFALLTTTLAFGTLLLRVSVVYVELGAALLHSWLFASNTPVTVLHHGPHPAPPTSSAQATPSSLLRHGGTNSGSSSSNDKTTRVRSHDLPSISSPNPSANALATTTPATPRLTRAAPHHLRTKSGSAASLATFASTGPTRDYEGVGGWRLAGSGDEEALWMGINARLELPAGGSGSRRHHQRRMSAGAGAGAGAGVVRMSPVQSRGRTPGEGEGGAGAGEGWEGYFNIKAVGEGRRRKGSGSSHSSAGGTPGLALKRTFVE
ncbi:MAG: hypothetical protein M1822_005251 [Bathelium mastoideum]|nr:MAG: hypothetical protein M1822_005251 [Bathelium mastoideum]